MHTIQSSVAMRTFYTLTDSWQNKIFVIDASCGCCKKTLGCMGNLLQKTVAAIALTLSVVVLPVFILLEQIYCLGKKIYQIKNPLLPDFHFAFSSSVFRNYAEQLRFFVDQKLSANIALARLVDENNQTENKFDHFSLELISCILKNKNKFSDVESQIIFHQTVLGHLRSAIEASGEGVTNLDLQSFITDLCEWMYAEVDLRDAMKEFVFGPIGKASKLDSRTLTSQAIEKTYDVLNKNSAFKGVDESALRLYDPHYLGDTPSVQYKITGNTGKQVKVIRTPVVTRDLKRDRTGQIVSTEPVPEFIEFLKAYQSKGKTHLYVNLMQRKGSEGIRSKQIEAIESIYPKVLKVICLDKDSNFYWQKWEHCTNTMNAEDFKNIFFDKMFKENNSCFYWSKNLDSDDLMRKTKAIFEKVHARYFKEMVVFNNPARLDFIELVYAHLLDQLIKEMEPETCNISCKSCIDRGASSHGLQNLISQSNESPEGNPVEEIAAFIFAPALLSMNRLIQYPRIPRLISAIKRYEAFLQVAGVQCE